MPSRSEKISGERFGQVLVKLKYLTQEDLRRALAEHLDIPYVDLDRIAIDKALAKHVSRTYAKRHCLVPLALEIDNTITMCLDDPTDQNVIDELTRTTRKNVTVVSIRARGHGRAPRPLVQEDRRWSRDRRR